ncbi:hypothetical protein HDV05_005850 [Chytridiales sp. JEL 0842]|nr:hypothetical protein HDV05_005850 [Chytridiales sp. JEL 0842]
MTSSSIESAPAASASTASAASTTSTTLKGTTTPSNPHPPSDAPPPHPLKKSSSSSSGPPSASAPITIARKSSNPAAGLKPSPVTHYVGLSFPNSLPPVYLLNQSGATFKNCIFTSTQWSRPTPTAAPAPPTQTTTTTTTTSPPSSSTTYHQTSVVFAECDLRDSNFMGVVLDDVKFLNSDLKGVQFSTCRFLRTCRFWGCDLRNANFSGARFYKLELKDCKMDGASFRDAYVHTLCMDSSFLDGAGGGKASHVAVVDVGKDGRMSPPILGGEGLVGGGEVKVQSSGLTRGIRGNELQQQEQQQQAVNALETPMAAPDTLSPLNTASSSSPPQLPLNGASGSPRLVDTITIPCLTTFEGVQVTGLIVSNLVPFQQQPPQQQPPPHHHHLTNLNLKTSPPPSPSSTPTATPGSPKPPNHHHHHPSSSSSSSHPPPLLKSLSQLRTSFGSLYTASSSLQSSQRSSVQELAVDTPLQQQQEEEDEDEDPKELEELADSLSKRLLMAEQQQQQQEGEGAVPMRVRDLVYLAMNGAYFGVGSGEMQTARLKGLRKAAAAGVGGASGGVNGTMSGGTVRGLKRRVECLRKIEAGDFIDPPK